MNERISIAIAPGDRAAEEEETRKAKFAPMMASMVPAGKLPLRYLQWVTWPKLRVRLLSPLLP